MKQFRGLFWGVLILFILVGCGGGSDQNQPTSELTDENSIPNLLVNASGKVYLRRAGWADFVPVGFGVAVNPGDLIQVETGGQVEIFCGDTAMWAEGLHPLESDGEEHGVPCRAGSPPRPWPDTAALRGEDDNFIPYVITPRNSALLNPTPVLHWFALPGVEMYTLSIISDDQQERSPVEVSGSQADWPETWPPMQIGATYVLLVEGDGKLSDATNQEHARLGFWLLAEDEAQTVQDLESQLRAQPVSPSAADLLVTELYLRHGLLAEALALMEGINRVDGSTSMWAKLGQLYLETGLPYEAQQAFEQGLALAQTNGELEAQADALFGLGLVYQLLDDDPAAEEQLLLARDIYAQIGSTDGLERVNTLLGE